jgi:hypothetical protein
MEGAFYLLLFVGHLGVFDVIYFHQYRCKLQQRPECQREVFWHTIRHLVYGTQFVIIANLRFHGAALILLALIYAADVIVAWSDVLEETSSRRSQGGLPAGEYFMHVVLSLLIGCYFILVGQAVWPDRLIATAIVVDPPNAPFALRVYMSLMGVGALGAFCVDVFKWLSFRKQPAVAMIQPERAEEA